MTFKIPWLVSFKTYPKECRHNWDISMFGLFINGGSYYAGPHIWVWRFLLMKDPWSKRWVVTYSEE